ncbi:kinase domain protein [Aspergillus aculeatinus CBS 121060]|uniref:Kinase domain protein n=1 Tax=Aspergillus aculeatinus CBS 121060 TaxID=1448322 RepID=A0ACD1HGF9_9EURO|nr:kinase domain protein [Aspergillus aculeatinus CBS 121060]RAH72489.1 kinase domain protein [Aspergillus aculeatinus CBS 121060]
MSSLRLSLPRFSPFLRKRPFSIPSHGPPLPPGILVDEEISPFYNSKCFYPAKPGEVLADRYHIVVKVGWGVSSTVWLARDLQRHIEEPETIVALKIANNNAHDAGHEREVEEHISTADPSHRGRSLIRTLLNSFEVQGPEGSHSCLVYPPLREPLSRYQQHFVDGRMPLPLIKTYIRTLLMGLDYLHQECRVVHTDLKLENIMVSFENRPLTRQDDQYTNPVTISAHSKASGVSPQLVDFGLATRLEEDDDWGIWPIQPDHYRAPEVILGIGWQMPADIWNLGVLLWDLVEGRELFQHIHDQHGRYDAKLHIAQMIALLGPPPPEILQRYQSMREFSLPGPVRREDGRVCENAEEYFCGPFFDNDGRFLYEDLIPDRRLGDTVSFLQGEEREAFLDLVGKMLLWNHNYRRLAGELAGHPFL